MNTQTVCAGLALALLSACAAVPGLPTIQNVETVSILVTRTEKPSAPIAIRNEAIGIGVSAAVGTGLVAGGLWGLACGPFAVLCVPLGLHWRRCRIRRWGGCWRDRRAVR